MKEILFKVKVEDKRIGRISEIDYDLYIPQYDEPMMQNFPLDLTKYKVLKVRQYTGYDDCKRTDRYPEGQLIYEGDVVIRRCEIPGDKYDGFIGKVKYIAGSAAYLIENFEENDATYLWDDVSEVEVIENPELLKEGDKVEGD